MSFRAGKLDPLVMVFNEKIERELILSYRLDTPEELSFSARPSGVPLSGYWIPKGSELPKVPLDRSGILQAQLVLDVCNKQSARDEGNKFLAFFE